VLLALALIGWLAALVLGVQRYRHACPHDAPTRAVLLDHRGAPESCRTLRGAAPPTYHRPHGKGIATVYRRVGTAAVYQP
jgi:hypothetical protein